MSRYILNEVETSHHLILCEILIANPIDWLFAACLEYFIFFSIDSSEARKQHDEYCLSIMQTITYAHDRTHFWLSLFINFLFITINEKNWFAESRFFVGVHYMEFVSHVKFRRSTVQKLENNMMNIVCQSCKQ
jgi:hypothetical protein